mmetsp:Transcript_37089/g.89889  ORF Transcript_37089/g.89889 Transcript_37089/m.89889 type:complete len:764 (+) Transcript_37089:1849-4140(+)
MWDNNNSSTAPHNYGVDEEFPDNIDIGLEGFDSDDFLLDEIEDLLNGHGTQQQQQQPPQVSSDSIVERGRMMRPATSTALAVAPPPLPAAGKVQHQEDDLDDDVFDSDGGGDDDDNDNVDNADELLDKKLARDLLGLSLEQRNQVMRDLHGTIFLLPEDPSEISEKLLTMEQEVRRIVAEDSPNQNDDTLRGGGGSGVGQYRLAYTEAENISTECVHDKKFRLMFLRADRYNPVKAARRLVDFFEIKKTLFGHEKLCKRITLMDLLQDDETKACLESGRYQISRYRDSSGRQIVANNGSRGQEFSALTCSRVSFCLYMKIVEDDDDAQRRGVVWVVNGLTKKTHSTSHTVREIIPVYFGAIHALFAGMENPGRGSTSVVDSISSCVPASVSMSSPQSCTQNPTQNSVSAAEKQNRKSDSHVDARSIVGFSNWEDSLMKDFVGQHIRIRLNRHYGSESDILKSLATFGIPREVTSNIDKDMIQWLQSELEKELSTLQMSNDAFVPNGNMQSKEPSLSPPSYQFENNAAGGSFELGSSPQTQFLGTSDQNNPVLPSGNNTAIDLSPDRGYQSNGRKISGDRRGQQQSSPKIPAHHASPSGVILTPSPNDILFGRSKISVAHPGNVRFKQLVEMNLDAYYSADSTRVVKSQIARAIVETLTEHGGRFLRKVSPGGQSQPSSSTATCGNGASSSLSEATTTTDIRDTINVASISTTTEIEYWVEVDARESQSKVAHQFRNVRQRMARNNQCMDETSFPKKIDTVKLL